MSDLSDLIARLRTINVWKDPNSAEDAIGEAVESIETLRRENDALKHDLARHVAIASEEATGADGLRNVLTVIMSGDPVDMALDPSWARRLAKAGP